MAVNFQSLLRTNLPRGATGFTGSQGVIGFTGSQGEPGSPGGYTGSQGEVGFTGSQGLPGPAGGYTGSQGDFGYTGSQGDIGFTGSQGPAGAVGEKGFTGSAGVGAQDGRFVNLILPGEISPPRVGVARFYPPLAMEVTEVYASMSISPTGNNFTFILRKNGFTAGTFLIPVGAYLMTPQVITPFQLLATDYVTVDVTGGGGRDLHVKLRYNLL
jgi:hypothetical protein